MIFPYVSPQKFQVYFRVSHGIPSGYAPYAAMRARCPRPAMATRGCSAVKKGVAQRIGNQGWLTTYGNILVSDVCKLCIIMYYSIYYKLLQYIQNCVKLLFPWVTSVDSGHDVVVIHRNDQSLEHFHTAGLH